MLNKVPLEIYDMICFFLPDLENLYNISHIRKCSDYFIKRILSCLHQLKKEKTFPNFPSDTFTQLMLLERLYNYNNNLNLSKYNLDKSDRYLTNIEDSFTPFHFFKYHDIEDASSHHPFRLFKESYEDSDIENSVISKEDLNSTYESQRTSLLNNRFNF